MCARRPDDKSHACAVTRNPSSPIDVKWQDSSRRSEAPKDTKNLPPTTRSRSPPGWAPASSTSGRRGGLTPGRLVHLPNAGLNANRAPSVVRPRTRTPARGPAPGQANATVVKAGTSSATRKTTLGTLFRVSSTGHPVARKRREVRSKYQSEISLRDGRPRTRFVQILVTAQVLLHFTGTARVIR